MRRPTVIVPGRLIAGRHPCAWGPQDAPDEVARLLEAHVTLFVDLTQEGELEPYASLVPPARHVRMPIRDFSVPAPERPRRDARRDRCGAGRGRPRVRALLGRLRPNRRRRRCWLVRQGLDPEDALARIAETRGLGCPQTLEQRLLVLGWEAGR